MLVAAKQRNECSKSDASEIQKKAKQRKADLKNLPTHAKKNIRTSTPWQPSTQKSALRTQANSKRSAQFRRRRLHEWEDECKLWKLQALRTSQEEFMKYGGGVFL